MPAILDTAPFPFHLPEARQLLETLIKFHPDPRAAIDAAQFAGVTISMISPTQGPAFVWKDVLAQAATDGLARKLVQGVHDRLAPASQGRPILAALLADPGAAAAPAPSPVAAASSPEQIHDAILAGFDLNDLVRLVKFDLDVSLDAIVNMSQPFSKIAFDLVGWAGKRNLTADLIRALKRANKTNPTVQALAE